MHTYIHTYIHTYMHACIHTYIHACHAYAHTRLHTYVCMYVCMHACMYIQPCVIVRMHAFLCNVARGLLATADLVSSGRVPSGKVDLYPLTITATPCSTHQCLRGQFKICLQGQRSSDSCYKRRLKSECAAREEKPWNSLPAPRYKEMCFINTSLFHLAHLITKISSGHF